MGLTLGAFGVRVWRLDWQPLWWDEGITVYTTVLNPAEWLEGVRQGLHPPLYYAVLHAVAFVGREPYIMRFPSVFFGVLMVPLLALTGSRLLGRDAGLVAALLLAFSPFALHHSQEARMYTLFPFMALLSWASLLGSLHRLNQVGRSILSWHYVVSLALTGATHYYALLLPIGQAGYMLVQPNGRSWLLPWLRSVAFAAALSLPWAFLLMPGLPDTITLKVYNERTEPWALLPFLGRYLQTSLLGYVPSSAVGWPALTGSMGFALATAVGMVIALRRKDQAPVALGLLASIAAPLALAYVSNFFVPTSAFPRLLSFTLGPLLLLTSLAFVRLATALPLAGIAGVAAAFVALIPVLGAYWRIPQWQELDYRPLARALASMSQPGDVVVYDLPWQMGFLASYLPGLQTESILLRAATEGAEARRLAPLTERIASARRVWYPAYQALGGTEGQGAHAYLTSRTYLAYDAHFGTTRLLLFDTSTDFLQVPTIQLNSPMGSDVQLLGFSLPTTDSGDPKLSYHRQEVIPLVLFWRTRSALDISYTAFVHLVDQTGRPVLFADDEPDGGRRPTTSWTPSETIADLHNVLIPPTLPPGRYGIHVGLYDALTGRRLPVEPPHAEGLLLTTVAVEPPP